MRSDLDICLKLKENNPMEKLTRFFAWIFHLSRSSRRKEAPFFAAALGHEKLEPPYVGCYSLIDETVGFILLFVLALASVPALAEPSAKVPRFSVDYMDKSVAPDTDFFHYADGAWLKNNPVPPDKSRWASFTELQERNWYLIHEILNSVCAEKAAPNSDEQKVRD